MGEEMTMRMLALVAMLLAAVGCGGAADPPAQDGVGGHMAFAGTGGSEQFDGPVPACDATRFGETTPVFYCGKHLADGTPCELCSRDFGSGDLQCLATNAIGAKPYCAASCDDPHCH